MTLELKQAGYVYSAGTSYETRALAAVDLEIPRASLTVVLGPTGSGKSTLLRLLAGLLEPSTGGVHLDGRPVEAGIAGARQGVGLAFQSPETQLFAETVAADVAFGPLNQGVGDEVAYQAAHESLEKVGLDPDVYGLRSPFGLSGGEARRVALAGVLATDPGYLLLDEPTAGLDARGRVAIMDIIESMRTTAGIVVVTHDAEHFLPGADRVLLIRDGEAVWLGPPDELLDSPGLFTEAGLEPPPVLQAQLAMIAAGADLSGPLTLDPHTAAAMMWRARGGAA